MIVNGYTVPDTLKEAQQKCADLEADLKRTGDAALKTEHALRDAIAMIEAARVALNAVEAPPKT
jgi:hypothetical protein